MPLMLLLILWKDGSQKSVIRRREIALEFGYFSCMGFCFVLLLRPRFIFVLVSVVRVEELSSAWLKRKSS